MSPLHLLAEALIVETADVEGNGPPVLRRRLQFICGPDEGVDGHDLADVVVMTNELRMK